MYNEVCIDIKIRSGCNCYDLGENFNKFFLSIKKKNGCQNTLGNIEWRTHWSTANKSQNILLLSSFFNKKCNADSKEINSFVKNLTIPELSNFQKQNCKGVLNEK